MTVDMLRALEANEIRYVVVGGVAAIAHGATRRTDDLDICYDTAEDNTARLADLVNAWNPRLRVSGEDAIPFPLDTSTLLGLEIVTLATDQGSLDLLQFILGVGRYEDCLLESAPVPIGDVTVRILGLEALIRAKETVARGKDLKALPELREALVELQALRAIHRQRQVDPSTLEPAHPVAVSRISVALRRFAEERSSYLSAVKKGAPVPPGSFFAALAEAQALLADPDEGAHLTPELRPLVQLVHSEAQRWKRHLQGGTGRQP